MIVRHPFQDDYIARLRHGVPKEVGDERPIAKEKPWLAGLGSRHVGFRLKGAVLKEHPARRRLVLGAAAEHVSRQQVNEAG